MTGPLLGDDRPAWLPGERGVVVALLAALVLLRFHWVFAQEFDSDEAQHLHVAWEWTQGRVPYRDFFDNHAPLFHLLAAPFASAVGERADFVVLARLASLPVFLATLATTFALGRALFGSRVAAWGAAVLAAESIAFNHAVEVRPDALWTLAWTAALLVLFGGRWTVRRAFAGGLLVGVAAGVSVKTALLLPALGAAALLVPVTCPGRRLVTSWRSAAPSVAACLAGTLVVPAAIAVAFASAGAWDDMVHDLVTHNLAAPAWAPAWVRVPCFLATALVFVVLLRRLSPRLRVPGDRARQSVLVGGALLHCAAAGALLGMPRLQTFLPAWPPIALGAAALLATAAEGSGSRPRRPRLALGLLAGCVLAAVALRMVPPSGRPTPGLARAQEAVLADVLRLTDPSETVLDPKGAAIFRRRPTRHVMEQVTREQFRRGAVEDDIPERMVAERTCVVVGRPKSYPRRTRAWLERFTIPVGRLRVAGAQVRDAATEGAGETSFEVAVPARYAIVAERGTASGTLDGRPYDGPRFLDAGTHAYRPGTEAGRVATVWAQAVERDFSPFGPDETVP